MNGDRGRSLAARREALRRSLREPLPGQAAHRHAWPEDLPGRLDPPDVEDYRCAAVLIALFGTEEDLPPLRSGRRREIEVGRDAAGCRFPLIRRREEPGPHGGQIALPGGRCDRGEAPVDCALREADEEVGLAPGQVEVLGTLTPVPVAVSRNRIVPVVGWVHPSTVHWRGQDDEVEEVLFADPDRLAAEGPRRVPRLWKDGEVRAVPAWMVPASGDAEDRTAQSAVVWGATAIILAEFLSLWRGLACPSGDF